MRRVSTPNFTVNGHWEAVDLMFKSENSENVLAHIIMLVTKWEHKLYVSAFCHQTSFPFVLLQPCFHSFLTSCDLSDFTLKFVIWKVKQNICILNLVLSKIAK